MKRLSMIILGLLVFGFGQCFAETEEANHARAAMLKRIQTKQMIIYRPHSTPVGTVTIFTDLDCGYCRKMHREVPKLVELGIEVRYMAYPRHGVGSESYNRMVSIWCAKDPKEAMTVAMEHGQIKDMTCQNSIEEQMVLGRRIGVSGTPTLIFSDGTLWGGYLSADRLAREAAKHTPKKE